MDLTGLGRPYYRERQLAYLFLVDDRAYIPVFGLSRIMSDRLFNEQHEWGGFRFPTTSQTDTGGQTVLASRPAAAADPSQVPFVASYSDELFAPAAGSRSPYLPYALPAVHDFQRSRPNDRQSPTITYPFPHHNDRPLPSIPLPYPLSSYNRTPAPPQRPVSSHLHPRVDVHQPPPASFPQPHVPFNSVPLPTSHSYIPFSSVPAYQSHAPFNPQIQYVYVPAPSSDALPLPPASKSLPVITTIHSLNSKTDFYAWDEGVCTLLRLLGIYGHIVDPQLPVDVLRPDISPALPPVLSQPPTPTELKALSRWQDNDNVAQYVIVGRLGGLARQLLPSASMGTRSLFDVSDHHPLFWSAKLWRL